MTASKGEELQGSLGVVLEIDIYRKQQQVHQAVDAIELCGVPGAGWR
jgi:hypothetical protein